MKTIITTENKRCEKFPSLFGSQLFKNAPLFSYAESLFYSGMTQFIEGYKGGFYEYVEIAESDVEIEPSSFVPMLMNDSIVEMSNPFGTTEKLTEKAASLVTWLFVLEQIANNINSNVAGRIFNVMEDVKYSYDKFTNNDGEKLFSPEDLTAIYRLTN